MKLRCILLFLVPFVSFAQPRMPMPDCPDPAYVITNNYRNMKWNEDSTFHYNTFLFGLTDRQGNTLLPIQYDGIIPLRDLNDSCGTVTPRFIITEGNCQFVYDAKTQKESSKHEFVSDFGDHFVFRDTISWGVMDNSFTVILENVPGEPAITSNPAAPLSFSTKNYDVYSFLLQHEDELMKKRAFKNENWVENWPEVLIFKQASPESIHYQGTVYDGLWWDPEFPFETDQFGLFEPKSRRFIDPVYHDINCKTFNKQIYYWCTRFERYTNLSKNMDYKGELHIYDQSLKLVKKMSFLTNPLMQSDLEKKFYYDPHKREIYPLENKKHRFGALDEMGNTVLPFQYDSILYLSRWYAPIFKAVKKNSVQLLDWEGNEFVSGKYADLNLIGNGHYILAKTDDSAKSWHLISKEGEQLSEGFERLFCTARMSNIHIVHENYKYLPILFGKADKQLYIFTNNKAKICDTSFLKFKQQTAYINEYIVAKKGNILYTGNYLLEVNTFGYLDLNSGCTTLLSMDCSKKLEIDDLSFRESDWYTGFICFQKATGDFATFDLKNWVWLED